MRSRDFKAEYQRLAEQLINVGEAVPESGAIDARILVSENDIHNYHQRILSQIQRMNLGKNDIFEALYDHRIRSSEKCEALKL
jgi:hypothetical protein